MQGILCLLDFERVQCLQRQQHAQFGIGGQRIRSGQGKLAGQSDLGVAGGGAGKAEGQDGENRGHDQRAGQNRRPSSLAGRGPHLLLGALLFGRGAGRLCLCQMASGVQLALLARFVGGAARVAAGQAALKIGAFHACQDNGSVGQWHQLVEPRTAQQKAFVPATLFPFDGRVGQ